MTEFRISGKYNNLLLRNLIFPANQKLATDKSITVNCKKYLKL